MKIFSRVKYFIKDMPLTSLKDLINYLNIFIHFGFHPNSLKGKSLSDIRKDKFINYLSGKISSPTPYLSNSKQTEKVKKITILFTINSFRGIGGTEVWLQQMVTEFLSRGVHCIIFTNYMGGMSSFLSNKGVFVTSNISDVTNLKPDLIHLHHSASKNISNLLLKLDPRIPIFNLIHGVVPILEMPYRDSKRQIVYGAVSQLVAEKVRFLTKQDLRKVHLIKNFFHQNEIPRRKFQSLATCAAISSKVSQAHMRRWINLFKDVGIQLDFYGHAPEKFVKNYEEIIDNYDFFLCTGKTSIDILGYGKPVILLEQNLLGPAVLDENIQLLSDMNFALINPLISATQFDDPDILHILKHQLEKISGNDFQKINDHLLKENSIKIVADRLLNIYFQLTIGSVNEKHESKIL